MLTLQILAVVATLLFSGAALYISVVEHPARMSLDTRAAAMQWAPSYGRATWLQAPLAGLGFVAGCAVWFRGGANTWLIGALLIGAVVPFTYGVIMATNHQLLTPGRDLTSVETRELLVRWGKLHGVRTVLSLASSGVFAWAWTSFR